MVLIAETDQLRLPNPLDIAIKCTPQCIDKKKRLKASGKGTYANGFWTRDGEAFGLGLLEIGSEEGIDAVESLLDFCLSKSPDIPYRVMDYNHMLFQIGLRIPNHKEETLIPLFKRLFNRRALRGEDPHVADTFVILDLAANFCTSSNVDQERKEKFWHQHEADIGIFIAEFTKPSSPLISPNGLVKEGPLASRADCLYKSGNVLLTNVYWYMTLNKLSEAAAEMQNPAWASRFGEMASDLHKVINDVFWDEKQGHYLDWVKNGTTHDQLDSLANSWAIVSGLANEEKGKSIIENMKSSVYKSESRLVATVDKEYDNSLFDWILRTVENGTAWFNDGDKGVFWPEMTIMFAAALKKVGYDELAAQVLESVEDLLREHQTLHETYGQDRQPIDYTRKVLKILPIHYHSAESFAMALGLYLWVKSNWDNLEKGQAVSALDL